MREYNTITIFLNDKVKGTYNRLVISAPKWDDYEVIGNLFVVKKEGAWVTIVNMNNIVCINVE